MSLHPDDLDGVGGHRRSYDDSALDVPLLFLIPVPILAYDLFVGTCQRGADDGEKPLLHVPSMRRLAAKDVAGFGPRSLAYFAYIGRTIDVLVHDDGVLLFPENKGAVRRLHYHQIEKKKGFFAKKAIGLLYCAEELKGMLGRVI